MRKFQFVGITALVAAVGLAMTVSSDSEAAGGIKRGGVAGVYGIQLAGATVGFASSVAGGGQNGNVALERSGAAGAYPKKRHVPAAPDEIVLSVGTADRPLADWVKATVNTATPQKKDGAIVAFSMDYKELSRTSWQRGAIVEVDFPELNAADNKKAWQIELTIAPEVTTYSTSNAGKADSGISLQKSKQNVSSNFRIAMPGLDLKRIISIEEIEVRFRQPPPAAPGDEAVRTKVSSASIVDVSNLAFVIGEQDAAQLYTWHQATRAGGGDKEKKTATIELLSPSLQPTTTKITLNGVGILRVGPLPSSAGSEAARRVRAECFVESVQLEM